MLIVIKVKRLIHNFRKYQYEHYYRDVYCRPVDVVRRLQLSLPEFVIFKTLALFSPGKYHLPLFLGYKPIITAKTQSHLIFISSLFRYKRTECRRCWTSFGEAGTTDHYFPQGEHTFLFL